MVEREEWRRRRAIEKEVPATQISQTQRALCVTNNSQTSQVSSTASEGYETAHQNPAFLKDPVVDTASFIGPGLSSIDRYAISNSTQVMWFNEALRGKSSFGSEYARLVQQGNVEIYGRDEKEVGPADEPGKWLADTGASNHYSSFKHLFVHLIPCIPLVEILTGNGWVFADYIGTIPLILRVEGEIVKVHIENVLYVPTLQTRVNLFSVVVLEDRGYYSNFGSKDVKFSLNGQVLAQGIKVGTSWWLDCDTRSHELCLVTQDKGTPRPDTLEVWYQRLGHLNKRDVERLQSMATGLGPKS